MRVIIFSHVLVFKPPAVLSLGLQFIAPEKQVHRTILVRARLLALLLPLEHLGIHD